MEKNKKNYFALTFFQFGAITDPWATLSPGTYPDDATGLITILNNLLRTAMVIAGIYSFINIILAGYEFMSAEGNPEKVTVAWNKIWQSLLGLIIIAGSFILAGVFGYLIFNDPTAILNPKVYGPGTTP